MLLTAVRALRFDDGHSRALATIPGPKWPEFLALCDAAHISLALAARCGDAAPEDLRSRLARNAMRYQRILAAHREIAAAMDTHGVEFLVLKGLTHAGHWNDAAKHRPQYDIDLYVPAPMAAGAVQALQSLGYTVCEEESKGSDHFPVMVRRTGWRWRGDYFDPDQPLAAEVHFRFCNPSLGFEAPGADRFWDRRRIAEFDGVHLPALHPVDTLHYACWHAVRHLLRGSLRILHVYELAFFLDRSSTDDAFWKEWDDGGVAESIAFRLASEWFGCRMHRAAQECARRLPPDVERWFRLFAFSPIHALTRPNKDEVFLQLCLARNLAAERVLPRHLPGFWLDAHDREENLALRWKRRFGHARFIASRAAHHARTLAPLIGSSVRWWWPRLPQ
ncbi:MAG TPA: nucleotidyltransferase family protein [Bryobacteraceae bacterium]|nr:nucleotidyltransferase family protein [Bryobacteraceae bacterium]